MQELILYNGCIITLDDKQPKVEAVYVLNEKIKKVGTDKEILKLKSENTKIIDLKKKTLIPGFNDNHIHSVIMGHHLFIPNLNGLNEKEIIDVLKDRYKDVKQDKIIKAIGWDFTHCKNPDKSILDRVFPRNPVVLIQYSGHGMWLNSAALDKFKLYKYKNNQGISKDKNGELTGLIKDDGAYIVHNALYSKVLFNKKLIKKYLNRSLAEFQKFGITSVQDNTWSPVVVSVLNSLKKNHKLSVRFSCWALGINSFSKFLFAFSKYDKEWITRGPDKYFLDGTFSTKSAWLTEPYRDDPANYGSGSVIYNNLENILIESQYNKRGLAFHAIGDRAIEEFLNTVGKLNCNESIKNLRIRLEHAQLIRKDDIKRLKEYGILISAQPSAIYSFEKDKMLIGEKRAIEAYPYKSILKAGIPLSFGSDFPGELTLNPLKIIHNAVNHPGDEGITPYEALKCYTAGSAYAEFKENEKGSITSGKFADMVVLSEDILNANHKRIKDIRVDMTIVGGKVINNI